MNLYCHHQNQNHHHLVLHLHHPHHHNHHYHHHHHTINLIIMIMIDAGSSAVRKSKLICHRLSSVFRPGLIFTQLYPIIIIIISSKYLF